MSRKDVPLVCQIIYIGKEQTFIRKSKPPFTKRIITLETEDGQRLHCELRRLHLLRNIHVGSVVDVKISFHGSEKNGKRYNNIFINSLIKK